MKISINSAIGITFVILFSITLTSCGETSHSTDNDHATEVTMTYTPNPIVPNIPTTFVFEIMDNMVPADVTDVDVTVTKGTESPIKLTATKQAIGVFKCEYTFKEMGTYKLACNYNHAGEMGMKDFTITIQ
ncbi:MAG: hypothetical protein HW421_1542 [Ignavibacteria bacterium]|nr:hypothetical protein [Ignavibacteria bacterium]